MLLIRLRDQHALLITATVIFAETSRPNHGPIQTAALQAALTNALPDQDQAEQVEGMPPTTGAQGAHQQHTTQTKGATGLHLRLHPPRIDLQGTRQIDRGTSTRGNHQRRTALQRMEQRLRRVQLQPMHVKAPLLLCLDQSRGQHGCRTNDRFDRPTALEGFIDNAPSRFAGGTRHR